MRYLFCLLFMCFQGWSQTLVGVEPIADKDLRAWHEPSVAGYAGAYHFGMSEAESELVLVVSGGVMTAQIRSGGWAQHPERWQWHYQTLTNVRVVGNLFYSTETTGRFVSFAGDSVTEYGLLVNKPWSLTARGSHKEVGMREVVDLKDYYDGQYAQASCSLLTPASLVAYSSTQLALMHNEVLARYGYRFAKGQPMQTYFAKQKWYKPEYSDVAKWLTPLERLNLTTIRKVEQQLALPK
ncbi:MAG: YARHG domain-containing protein [Janthinobacterium lividum]